MKIEFKRWPWQVRKGNAAMSCAKTERIGEPYGWFPTKGTGRFGGGWNFKLGISASRKTLLLDLILGSVRIEL